VPTTTTLNKAAVANKHKVTSHAVVDSKGDKDIDVDMPIQLVEEEKEQ